MLMQKHRLTTFSTSHNPIVSLLNQNCISHIKVPVSRLAMGGPALLKDLALLARLP